MSTSEWLYLHETLNQGWYDIGPPPATSDQFHTNLGLTYRVAHYVSNTLPDLHFIS